MKTIYPFCLIAILLMALPCRTFGQEIEDVTPARATELGIEVRDMAAGQTDVRVEMEFKLEGPLKRYSRVDLRYGDKDVNIAAPLREDHDRPNHVQVNISADRSQLRRIRFWILVPNKKGGTAYQIHVKDFVK